MAYPTLKVEIDFTGAVGASIAAATWTDVTADVCSTVDVITGRQAAVDLFQPGTGRFSLNNALRKYDPENAASPYYPNIKPRRRVRITATVAGTPYPLAFGYIDQWTPRFERPAVAETDVTFTDAFGIFQRIALPDSLWAHRTKNDPDVIGWWRPGADDAGTVITDWSNSSTVSVKDAGYYANRQQLDQPPATTFVQFQGFKTIAESPMPGTSLKAFDSLAAVNAATQDRFLLSPTLAIPDDRIPGSVWPPGGGTVPPDWTIELWVKAQFQADTSTYNTVHQDLAGNNFTLYNRLPYTDSGGGVHALTGPYRRQTLWKYGFDPATDSIATMVLSETGHLAVNFSAPGWNSFTMNSGITFNDGQSHLITLIRTGAVYLLYVDGQQRWAQGVPAGYPSKAPGQQLGFVNSHSIGAAGLLTNGINTTYYEQLVCVIGDLVRWKRALTYTEVTTRYNEGTAAFNNQVRSERVTSVLADVTGWVAPLDLASGATIVAPFKPREGDTVLAYLQRVAEGIGAVIYMGPAGEVSLRRGDRATTSVASRYVQLVIADAPPGGFIPDVRWETLQFSVDDIDVTNEVTVNYVGGSVTRRTGTPGLGGIISQTVDSELPNIGSARTAADFRLTERFLVRTRVSSLTIRPVFTGDFLSVAALKIADRVRVNWTHPASGTVLTSQYLVEQIKHTFGPGIGDWQTTLTLTATPADPAFEAFVLDHATYGALDSAYRLI